MTKLRELEAAMDLIVARSGAKYSRVNVPVAIREALRRSAAEGPDAEREVLEAIGVLCGFPLMGVGE